MVATLNVALLGAGLIGALHAETLARRLHSVRLAVIADPVEDCAPARPELLRREVGLVVLGEAAPRHDGERGQSGWYEARHGSERHRHSLFSCVRRFIPCREPTIDTLLAPLLTCRWSSDVRTALERQPPMVGGFFSGARR